jgi:hypothetical protein
VASVLQQLQSNEAVLLMYLADELPGGDRTEVERMLAVDAGMREQLERLREAYGRVADEVARADASTRPAVSEGAAVRRVGRAMRQWHARRLAEAPAPAAAPVGLRYPWWAYPLAAAASVVIAFLVWWGNTDRPPAAEPYAYVVPDATDEENLANADPATVANYRSDMILTSLGFGEVGPDGLGGPPPPTDWDEVPAIAAAIAPSDANVLMLQNNANPADDGNNDAAPDDEPTIQ